MIWICVESAVNSGSNLHWGSASVAVGTQTEGGSSEPFYIIFS